MVKPNWSLFEQNFLIMKMYLFLTLQEWSKIQ